MLFNNKPLLSFFPFSKCPVLGLLRACRDLNPGPLPEIIGRAVALRLARDGAKLALAARSVDKLAQVKKEAEALGATALAITTDVTQIPSVEQMVGQTLNHLGRIDILVNNAGIEYIHRIQDLSHVKLMETMATNFYGAVYCTQAVLQSMLQQGRGQIVNIASVAAIVNPPYEAAYTASKYALVGYSRAIRRELRSKGIRVLIVYPVFVQTPMLEKFMNSFQPTVRFVVKPLEPERFADSVLEAMVKNKKEVIPGVPTVFRLINNITRGRLAEWLTARTYE